MGSHVFLPNLYIEILSFENIDVSVFINENDAFKPSEFK